MKTGKKNSNWTNPMNTEIRDLFQKYVLKESASLKESKDPFHIHADKNLTTYYESPRHLSQLSYELMDLDNEKDFTEHMTKIWKDSPSLLLMIPEMVKAALALKEQEKDQSADLDSFIYVMY